MHDEVNHGPARSRPEDCPERHRREAAAERTAAASNLITDTVAGPIMSNSIMSGSEEYFDMHAAMMEEARAEGKWKDVVPYPTIGPAREGTYYVPKDHTEELDMMMSPRWLRH